MPYFLFTVMHWSRIDLPKASAPAIIAILVMLALLHVLENLLAGHEIGMRGLEIPFLDRRHRLHGAGEIDQRHLRLFRQRNDRHGAGRGRTRQQRVDLVLLDQPGREGARLVRVAGIVINDELDLLAVDAALGVDVGDIHFQRLLLGIAEERRAAGDRQHRADLDLGLRRDRASAASAAAAVIIFSGSLIAVLP